MQIQHDLKLFFILLLEIFIMYYSSRSINQYTSNLLCNILYIVLIKYIAHLVCRLTSQRNLDFGTQEGRLYIRDRSITNYKQKFVTCEVVWVDVTKAVKWKSWKKLVSWQFSRTSQIRNNIYLTRQTRYIICYLGY